METIIGKNLDFTLTGDSFEDLKYKSERSCYELSDIRIAEDDGRIIIDETTNYFATAPGQAITSTEVVDYYEGDLVLVVVYYGKNTRTKIIVVSDAVAKDDIQRWFEEIKQIDNE